MKKITTDGKAFVTDTGKVIIPHGINMVCKDRSLGYIGDYTDEDFKMLKSWNFNIVRLGIFWDGAEPTPGVYDEAYFSKLDAIIEKAAAQGISVYLDMHQDLFSRLYSDGAPDWATLTDGCEHVQTELWSEAYLLSPAVQHAFDNFWNNTPAADGIGLQDHYCNLWAHIASRYRNNPWVVGYDVMNEPFPGSSVNQLMPELLLTAGSMMQPPVTDIEQLMGMWLDPEQKLQVLGLLADKELYTRLMRQVEHVSAAFETEKMLPFYTKAARAIHAADPDAMIFLEANYFCNCGMKCALKPVVDEGGAVIPHQVYSPHGYDLLVDTDMYDQSCNDRLDVIFDTHSQVQEETGLPMLVGEWGCFPAGTEAQLAQAEYLLSIFNRLGAGDTYFDFSHIKGNRISEALKKAR